jgi:hypothetical protein
MRGMARRRASPANRGAVRLAGWLVTVRFAELAFRWLKLRPGWRLLTSDEHEWLLVCARGVLGRDLGRRGRSIAAGTGD